MSNSVIAVHQPNFLPWLGYFNKIVNSDKFIILDDVQFPKKGGNWINRHQLSNNGKPIWVTLPVKRDYSGVKKISEIQIDDSSNWCENYLRRLTNLYRAADFFKEIFPILQSMFNAFESRSISYINVYLIYEILKILDLKNTHIELSSSFGIAEQGTSRLIKLAHLTETDIYLSGRGSSGYLNEELFNQGNVLLVYQNFYDIPYSQLNCDHFLPRLSIVDCMMNIGIASTRKRIIQNAQ